MIKLKYCKRCGTVYPSEYNNDTCQKCECRLTLFCTQKDDILETKSFCPKCLTLRTDSINRCKKCGTIMTVLESYQHNPDCYRKTNKTQSSRLAETNIPKCPTCQSTKIKKISELKKATGFMMVGIFSNNFGKTMECENCGYKW